MDAISKATRTVHVFPPRSCQLVTLTNCLVMYGNAPSAVWPRPHAHASSCLQRASSIPVVQHGAGVVGLVQRVHEESTGHASVSASNHLESVMNVVYVRIVRHYTPGNTSNETIFSYIRVYTAYMQQYIVGQQYYTAVLGKSP